MGTANFAVLVMFASATGDSGPIEQLRAEGQKHQSDNNSRDHLRDADRNVEACGSRDEQGTDNRSDAPGSMERGEDEAALGVLDRDCLHVGGRVDHAESDAVDRQEDEEHRCVGRNSGCPAEDCDDGEPSSQGHLARRSHGQHLGEHAAEPGDDGHGDNRNHNQCLAQLEQVLVLRQLRQNGGEQKSLKSEGHRSGDPKPSSGCGVLSVIKQGLCLVRSVRPNGTGS